MKEINLSRIPFPAKPSKVMSLFTHREKQWQISIERLNNGNKYSSNIHQAVCK